MIRRAFGMALRTLRLRAGYSQEALASQGISRGHISEMEHGRHDPRLSTLLHLADLLHLPLSTLIWETKVFKKSLPDYLSVNSNGGLRPNPEKT